MADAVKKEHFCVLSPLGTLFTDPDQLDELKQGNAGKLRRFVRLDIAEEHTLYNLPRGERVAALLDKRQGVLDGAGERLREAQAAYDEAAERLAERMAEVGWDGKRYQDEG